MKKITNTKIYYYSVYLKKKRIYLRQNLTEFVLKSKGINNLDCESSSTQSFFKWLVKIISIFWSNIANSGSSQRS